MRTEVLTVDAFHPDQELIQRAAAVIGTGGLVAFPTETVYGLGANALDAAAVARIFAAKGRPATNPLIVHVTTLDAAQRLTAAWPDLATVLAQQFWPGPLTLVLPKAGHVPDLVTAGGTTVALRIPSHPVARALIEAAGVPLAAPSANRSNQLSATLAAHVFQGLDGRIEMLLDGGPTAGGLESTVLDLSGAQPRLLRPGLISPAEISRLIGPIDAAVSQGSTIAPTVQQPLPSPGMLERHYAPRATLERVSTGLDVQRVLALAADGHRVGWLPLAGRDDLAGLRPLVTIQTMPVAAAAYAAQLYAALHELDAAGVERIIVELPPADDAWLAIHDRLRRASHPVLDKTAPG